MAISLRTSPNKVYTDRDKIKVSYLNTSIHAKQSLKRDFESLTLTSVGTEAQIESGILSVVASDQGTIVFNTTFERIPKLLLTPSENVNLSVTLGTASAIVYASGVFTGNIHWLALNETTTTQQYIIVASGTKEAMVAGGSKTITFDLTHQPKFEEFINVLNITPTIILMPEANVNMYVTNVTKNGFVANASAPYTGNFHWLAIVVKRIT